MIPSSHRFTFRSRVFAFTETGKARAIGPPSTLLAPSGSRSSCAARAIALYRSYPAKSSSPASPVSATVTSLRVSRDTYHVGNAELSANGSSN